jgi:hypothetical protein
MTRAGYTKYDPKRRPGVILQASGDRARRPTGSDAPNGARGWCYCCASEHLWEETCEPRDEKGRRE